MKLAQSPHCELCPLKTTGTFIHMIWECHAVSLFWNSVVNKMSSIFGFPIPCSPIVLLLNDFSTLSLTRKKQRWLLVCLTAAKRMVALRWKAPHSLSLNQWESSVLDLATLEMSVARMHGAEAHNINTWSSFIDIMHAGN